MSRHMRWPGSPSNAQHSTAFVSYPILHAFPLPPWSGRRTSIAIRTIAYSGSFACAIDPALEGRVTTRRDPGTLSRAISTPTASLSNPDWTSPTNEQRISSSTPITTAPWTRPIPALTTPTSSQVLPSRLPRLYGPTASPTDLNRRGIITNHDLPRHVVRPRAIERHSLEGGQKRVTCARKMF